MHWMHWRTDSWFKGARSWIAISTFNCKDDQSYLLTIFDYCDACIAKHVLWYKIRISISVSDLLLCSVLYTSLWRRNEPCIKLRTEWKIDILQASSDWDDPTTSEIILWENMTEFCISFKWYIMRKNRLGASWVIDWCFICHTFDVI